jgi:YD repeat-containing protein
VYDAENKMTAAQDNSGVWAYYTYNADGQRTRRKINNQETWQVYGFDGELLAEYPVNGAANQPTKEYGYRDGQLLISAEAGNASAPPAFADDFNDNSLNANSWSVYYPGTSPTVSEQSQQLQMTLSPNTAAYNGVYSNATYDLTNRMVQVESVQAVSQAGWCENYLEVELNANNYFMIQVGAGNMILRSRVNGVNDQTSIPFDAAANRFWRIRHDQSTNQIYFETSANDSVWLTRKTVTPGFALTSLRFDLLAGAWGTGNGSPGAAKYDNFKLLPSSAGSVSLSVPNAGFETPVLGNGNFQYAPSGGSWSFANGGGISGMNSPFTGAPSSAPDGVQVAFIQATGTISQSISGFQASANYVITFSAIQRTNCCNTTGQDIGVYIDSTLVGTFHPGNSAYVEYSTTPRSSTRCESQARLSLAMEWSGFSQISWVRRAWCSTSQVLWPTSNVTTTCRSAKSCSHRKVSARQRWVIPPATVCGSSSPQRNGMLRQDLITF